VSGVLAAMLGVRRLRATLSNISAADVVAFPTDAEAGIRVSSDTAVSKRVGVGSGYINQFLWDLDDGVYPTSNYEVMVTGTGSEPSGSALDTWLNLGSARTWELIQSSFGNKSFSGTYSIRDATTHDVLATATFALQANSVPV
jgi:hypothetical protein